jgi:hypothetical protein
MPLLSNVAVRSAATRKSVDNASSSTGMKWPRNFPGIGFDTANENR